MKTLLRILLGMLVLTSAGAADGRYLNVAILTLPPRWLADVPMEQRAKLLETLSSWPFEDDRLDYANGWLHYRSDNPRRGVDASSMFWIKVLPRQEGDLPAVLVHASKPFADGSAPAAGHTAVLEMSDGQWREITTDVLPPEIDRTFHFRPRRKGLAVEVAGYASVPRRDGQGDAYRFGPVAWTLTWKDGRFNAEKAAGKAELASD